MALPLLLLLLMKFVDIQGRTEVGAEFGFQPDNMTHFDVYASALSKAHYNPWVCSYRTEPGYKCLSCHKALHCYPSNFALLVQCAGLFPYCRNGYCSRFKTEGCVEESDNAHAVNTHSTMPPYVSTSKPTSPKQNSTEEMNAPVSESTNVIEITSESQNVTEIIREEIDSVSVTETTKPEIRLGTYARRSNH
ncbi:uncharacterized protein LOC113492317 [Trichoplusia ni]|uniref:Uncharacterized protein LOC113492317 n=1 Tax=Trichoplusia ni TaxID=7111 RepID=A0A7E5VBB8_TRINI|nr:uncharacterized protein LOC113492317 [Trichoplusia ni]